MTSDSPLQNDPDESQQEVHSWVRLERSTPWGVQRGCSLVIGLILGVITTGLVPAALVESEWNGQGPAKLYSLRANLLCFRITRDSDRRTSERRTVETLLDQWNLLDARDVGAAAGETWEQTAELLVPWDAPASGWADGGRIAWKIEVWGNVKLWPDFMHPFDVKLLDADETG